MRKHLNKKAQLTLFIIVGVVLVAAVAGFFIFRSPSSSGLPEAIEPVQRSFLNCVEEETLKGINLLSTRGGYIELPSFEPGSEYMPFSSYLHFAGVSVPYWYYVSGNNIQKEQVPSLSFMESELENYLEERVASCDFSSFYDDGYVISFSEALADVSIEDREVFVDIRMPFMVEKGEESSVFSQHYLEVKSSLGSLYKDAKKIYDFQQENLFLENYGIDILRIYAPVDGVELSCSPKVWSATDVFKELQEAIEANTMALKVKSGDYSLDSKDDQYFVLDVRTENDVRFLNSPEWSYAFEVNPSDGPAMIAKPVGNQPGMGIIGFCYVPYHFVYNLRYPVMVQVMDGIEIFQFPFAVVVQGNKPREALETEAIESFMLPELCKDANTEIGIRVYDEELVPVKDAEVSFECFGSSCKIGTSDGIDTLYGMFPQCANGKLIVKAEGFKEKREILSSVNENVFEVFLEREYEKEVLLNVGGQESLFDAIITFVSEDSSQTISYPEQKSVKLSEGQYEVQVSIYRNTSLKLAETTTEQCVEVPSSGVGAIFGLTKEKCFEIKIPPQVISNALSGGGIETYYILESELKTSDIIEINAGTLPVPKTLEDLQKNYIVYESKGLTIGFV
jgi:hypothetical protein